MTVQSFDATEIAVIQWAEARKIIPNSTPVAQARKTLEEAGELLEAAAKLQALNALADAVPRYQGCEVFCSEYRKAEAEFKDAAGDVMVTLVNACALADVTLRECFASAYEEIKDRKGTLLPSGVFQKAQ